MNSNKHQGMNPDLEGQNQLLAPNLNREVLGECTVKLSKGYLVVKYIKKDTYILRVTPALLQGEGESCAVFLWFIYPAPSCRVVAVPRCARGVGVHDKILRPRRRRFLSCTRGVVFGCS
jgi:hypothetical protein